MSGSPSRGDVLAAASLLLAIVAVLYSLWYSEIAATLDLEVPRHLEDAGPARRRTAEVLKTRALPLALSTLVLMLVFLPEAIHIVLHWSRGAYRRGVLHAIRQYDPVSLALVLVVIAIGALAAYTLWLARRLVRQKRRLTPR
jgi:hypothetical protein